MATTQRDKLNRLYTHLAPGTPLTSEDLAGSWHGLAKRALAPLGEVPISRVKFDATRRKEIDVTVLEELAAPAE